MFDFEEHYNKSILITKEGAKQTILKLHCSDFNKNFIENNFIKTVAGEFNKYITVDRTGFAHKVTGSFPLLVFLRSEKISEFIFPSINNTYLKGLLSEETKKTFKTRTGEKKLTQFCRVIQLLDIKDFFKAYEFIEKFEEFAKKVAAEENKDIAKRMNTALTTAKELINFKAIKSAIDLKMKEIDDEYKEEKKKIDNKIQEAWNKSPARETLVDESIKKRLREIMQGKDPETVLDNLANNLTELEELQKNIQKEQRMQELASLEGDAANGPIIFSNKLNGQFLPFEEPAKISQGFDEGRFYPLGEMFITGKDIKFLNSISEKMARKEVLSPQEILNVLEILDSKVYQELINEIEKIFQNKIEEIFQDPLIENTETPVANFSPI